MTFEHVTVPQDGQKITVQENKLEVPDNPILCYIEGDGIGPDITRAAKRIWDAAVQKVYSGQRRVSWMEIYCGEKAMTLYPTSLPDDTLKAIQEFVVAIKGPLTTPVGGGFRSLNVSLRQLLDLYACVRPVRWYPGVPSPVKEPQLCDVVIFRENTEDVYAGIEYESGSEQAHKLAHFLQQEFGAKISDDAGIGIKPLTKFGSQRLIRKAIRYALDTGRKSVTLVHKGNIQKYTEGAFRTWGYELARSEFGDVTISEEELWQSPYNGKAPAGKIVIKDRIADIMFQMMLLRPAEFDVIATPNLNGDYLSDAVAAQVGGVGIAPGANIADFVALFEATHGTAPKYSNLDKVNPGSLLFSGVMMFDYIGWPEVGKAITQAYEKTIAQKVVTYDFARQMDGAREVKTSEFASAIIANL